MPNKSVLDLIERIKKLENSLVEHLVESGGIKANLKWNTTLTVGIALAVFGKLVYEFFARH